jgi:hypothetical protein
MKLPPPWRRRLFFLATIVAIVLLSAHPELRLFVPLMDAFGFDLFALLVGAQAWDYLRPTAHWVRDRLAIPLARRAYALALFLSGFMGPLVDAEVASRFGRRGTMLPA